MQSRFRPGGPIPPHGGRLVERLTPPETQEELAEKARTLPQTPVDRRTLSDLRLLAVGALSPLEGFMDRRNYQSVLERMRLMNGLIWSIPITLPVDSSAARNFTRSDEIALVYRGVPVALVQVTDVFQPDKAYEAIRVYGVDTPEHPGVRAIYETGDTYVAGPVSVLPDALTIDNELARYQLTPAETRRLFQERAWTDVTAFQTRNPIHRAHEYLQKCALEMSDGLFIHPIVGETKSDDLDAETRFACYERILSRYYPQDRVILGAFPASMRYAGPREAVFHAICRKNYGCTHFIVGRDHAGVGNYYGTYDAQRIFDQFDPAELGIRPLPFEHAFYCRTCQGMATSKTCPHPESDRVILSGTKVREMIRRGEAPPPEFTRPEVAEILVRAQAAVVAGTAGGESRDSVG